jgi:hypothetical protein
MQSSYNKHCVLIKQSIGSLPSSDLDAMLLAHFFNPKIYLQNLWTYSWFSYVNHVRYENKINHSNEEFNKKNKNKLRKYKNAVEQQSIGSLPSSDLDAMLLAHFFNPKIYLQNLL